MNSKHRKTLVTVFRTPVSPSIEWQDIESLLIGIGCQKREGKGSRVRFRLNGIPLNVHRPHPSPHAKRYLVRDVRAFLEEAGVKP